MSVYVRADGKVNKYMYLYKENTRIIL